jgi:DnaK suppressor protein
MKKTEKKGPEKKSTNTTSSCADLSVQLNIIMNSLLQQKSEILNRNNEFKRDQTQFARFSDETDQTAQELQNNVSIQLHERERKSLLLIEKTLSKFADGTYGFCDGCGDQIGLKRLEARPMAPLCISCMEDLEEVRSSTSNTFQ